LRRDDDIPVARPRKGQKKAPVLKRAATGERSKKTAAPKNPTVTKTFQFISKVRF